MLDMPNKFLSITVSLLAATLVFAGCTKSDVISSEQDVAGTWAVTDIRSNIANDWDGDGYSETDIYSTYSYCQRDIVLVFDEYGTGQGRQGCNSYWRNLNWQLTNGNTSLRIDMTGDVIELNNLRVNYNTIHGDDYVSSNGRNYTITYTLQRR
jgi:hypothetical protein